MTRLLLDAGADVNARADPDIAALHLGVLNANLEMVKLLLNSGSDVNVRADNGKTPLQLATDPAVIELLRAHGATR